MNAKNASSDATAKLCPEDSIDHAFKTSTAIGSVLQAFLDTITNSTVSHGEFGGDDRDKRDIADIVGAIAGLKDLTDYVQNLRLSIIDLHADIDAYEEAAVPTSPAEESPKDKIKRLKIELAAAQIALHGGTYVPPEEYDFVTPGPGANPEALAHLRFEIKQVAPGQLRDDDFNWSFGGGRKVTLRGNRSDINDLIAAAKVGLKLSAV